MNFSFKIKGASAELPPLQTPNCVYIDLELLGLDLELLAFDLELFSSNFVAHIITKIKYILG